MNAPQHHAPNMLSQGRHTSAFGLERIWEDGARVSRVSKVNVLGQLTRQAWRSFMASPFTSFLTILTTMVVLFVFGTFVMVLENISGALISRQSVLTLRLYVNDGSTQIQLDELKDEVTRSENVESIRFITKPEALKEFHAALGEQAGLLDGLENDNPLPASFEVKFKSIPDLDQVMTKFAEKFHSNSLVQHVQYSHGILGRIADLLKTFRIGGTIAVSLMFLIAAFVISVTIRLALYAHRQEIQIMKLVGATDRFIQTPFLIEGAVQGLVGAGLGLGLLVLGYGALGESTAALGDLWAVGGNIEFLSSFSVFLVVLAGPMVGLVGSYLAVRRFSAERHD